MENLRTLFKKLSGRQNSPIVGHDGTCQEALGIETLGGVCTTMIKKGSLVPCRVTETLSTAADRQAHIEINVFRGVGDKVADTHPLGVYKLIGIPLTDAGRPKIYLSFEITRMRDIYLTAELESSKEKLQVEKYLNK